jgi:hypothetical protein
MHGIVFDIGLGLGLAAACGLRPFLPLLLAGALASAGALGVDFGPTGHAFHFLQTSWWLLVVAATLTLAYVLQLLLGLSPVPAPAATRLPPRPFAAAFTILGFKRERRREDALASAIAGLGLGAGVLVCAGTLSAHGDAVWPGFTGGFAALVAQGAVGPVIARARTRLPDRAAREALTLYLDGAALALAALVALLHPLGYIALALLLWLAVGARRRAGEKYAGLRILRR